MSRSPPQAPAEARLPVAVITGFLGSGKTTLVKHILADQQSLRTGVIVNELSELGIDGELIVSADGDMVELENGCICCSMNNDFVDAIFRVLNRGRKLDYLVVETSGVSDPLPVVLTFLRSELRDRVRVDSIITVADVADFCLDRFESKAARNQLCHGDVVLLNKCDLAGADALRTVETAIRGINPQARMVRTTQCRSRSLSSSVSDCSSRTAFSPFMRLRRPKPSRPRTKPTNSMPAARTPPIAIIWRRTVSRPFHFRASSPSSCKNFRIFSSSFRPTSIARKA